ncbi:cyclophilin family peptidyl-prolyl cis-trans isomerase [Archangium gephyra]|uniref:peptidylprolyl isomerase n=1 Tax=Archangium gephyra TaxID=48 RepID=A0AAC8TE52_9BACT|nr:peptidylprolyl isomerase [Archangium gephyra]AKJ02655.1 Peptidyl-prolyl cis-trans isomerase PpiA precursor [Archangium gephyra]REG23200.1 cyclophilin family peptidyl-prolyl cis-trans isomerase [Archangium gephyra]
MEALRAAVPACLLWGLVLSGCVRSVPSAAEAGGGEDIALWEDRRSLAGGRLVELAAKGSVPVRVRALRALARIQEPSTLEAVLAGLGAAEVPVRDEAAFAAGVLALSWEPLTDAEKARMTEALLAAEGSEKDEGVRRTLLESLGKLATPGALKRLTERLSEGNPEVAGRAAVALGVAARRGASLAEVPLERAAVLLQPGQPEASRFGGAYLLASAKRPDGLGMLRRCLGDEAPDVRALCAKGIGDVGGPEDAAVVGRLLGDEVPRVAAEASRALAKLATRCSGDCAPLDELQALASQVGRVAKGDPAAGHALLALAQLGLPEAGRPVLMSLRRALQEATPGAASEVAAGDLMNLDCRLAAALDRQTGALDEALRCGGGWVRAVRRLSLGLREVAQSKGRGGASSAVQYLSYPDTRVRLAALDAVASRPVPEAAGPVRALLEGKDLVEAAAAASTAGKLKDAEALPLVRALAERVPQEPDMAAPVAEGLVELAGKDAEPVLRKWLEHPHANVRRVAAESLAGLTGQPVRAAQVESPDNAHRPEPAPVGSTLTFHTNKGDFTVALDAEAPLTSGNLVTLARGGYFRGITFHRVVPDFVAQAGDPRGDGEGGPGYSIRCELTRRPYRRAVLGMALSGKDTGGSQFFFTHSPQPHLDGRYTAFGEVTRGMEVVDRLLEGDTIQEVEVSP